ncbi:MAG: hypothetical protein ACJATA_000169 [Sphingobacteriales bacterium]|jgi:hypothetical protein
MKYVLLFLSCLLVSGSQGFSQSVKYSNEFLNIGVGARAQGLSKATVASNSDVSSGFWNPAGLTRIEGDMQIGLMHAEYFAGIANFDYGAISRKIDDKSAIAFTMIRFGVDDIPNTTQLISAEGNINYDRVTGFSAADYAFLVSYGRELSIEGLSVGANAKVVRRVVGDFANSWGFGVDVGAQYQIDNFGFGLMVKDITTTFNAWQFSLDSATRATFNQTGNEIPQNSLEITLPQVVAGVNYSATINDKFGVMAEADLFITTDGPRNVLISYTNNPISIDPAIGLELDYAKIIYLRGGFGNFQEVKLLGGGEEMTFQPNFGLGLQINRFSIDYALTDVGDQSDALFSHIFSLRLDINK